MAKKMLSSMSNKKGCSCSMGKMILAVILIAAGLYVIVAGFQLQTSFEGIGMFKIFLYYVVGIFLMAVGKFFKKALYISGIFLHLHPADDPMMVTFEQTPEHLSLAVRVQDAAVGDTLKLVRRQEKPFFGVLVNTEGLIFSYQEHGKDRGCKIDSFQDLGAKINPCF